MPRRSRRSVVLAAWSLSAVLACDRDAPADAPSEAAAEAPVKPPPAPPEHAPPPPEAPGQPPPSAPLAPPTATDDTTPTTDESPASPPAEPLERRLAKRALMVYAEPRRDVEFRGKIPRHEVFEVFERVEGPECRGAGWGRLGTGAYACLQSTEAVDRPAVTLPKALPDGIAPFLYARLRGKKGSENHPPAPRWRSYRAMRAEAPPEGFLQREHDYAFVRRRRLRDGWVLYDNGRRVVRESDVRRMRPSDFAGRDLLARPVPDDRVMAWSIQWPHAAVRAEPHPEAEEVGRLPLHAEALAHDEVENHRGVEWVSVAEPAEGWVLASEVRRWTPMDPPAEVAPDQVWLDVNLDQQMLALRRGAEVEFLTLVSSGNWKHGTPTGLFRIEGKWAFADMRSRAGDDDTYFVEGVPWVLYFRGRYALHGTFWHDRFGRRTSHGCINLSAHDARWVYEHTAPHAPPGWLVTYEHPEDLGTLLRIRKGTTPPRDRRRPPRGT